MNALIAYIVVIAVIVGGMIFAFSGTASEKWENNIYTTDTKEQITETTIPTDDTTPASTTFSGEWGQEIILIYTDGTEESLKSAFDNPAMPVAAMFIGEKEVDKIKLMIGAKVSGTGYDDVEFDGDTYFYTYTIYKDYATMPREENSWKSSDYGEPDYLEFMIPVDGKWHNILVDTTDADEIVPESLAVGTYTFSLSHGGTLRSKISGEWYETLLPSDISFEFEIRTETAEEITENEPPEEIPSDLAIISIPFNVKLNPIGDIDTTKGMHYETPIDEPHWKLLSDGNRETGVQVVASSDAWRNEAYTIENIELNIKSIEYVELHGLFSGRCYISGEKQDGNAYLYMDMGLLDKSSGIFSISDSLNEKSYKWNKHPITNNPWSKEEINSLEAGIGISGIYNRWTQTKYAGECYEFWVEVKGMAEEAGDTTMSVDYDGGYVIT